MQASAVTQTTSTPQAFSRRITRLIKILLLLLVAAALVGAALVLGTDRPAPLAMAPSALEAERLQLAALASRESSDMVYRPLFWEGRRPLEEPAQVVVNEPQRPNRLEEVRLLGVFSTTGQAGVILTVRNERRRVVLGETVEGWRLVGVTAGQAIFERGGNDAENDESLRQVALELERNTHE